MTIDSHRMQRITIAVAIFAALSAVSIACGGNGSSDTPAASPPGVRSVSRGPTNPGPIQIDATTQPFQVP